MHLTYATTNANKCINKRKHMQQQLHNILFCEEKRSYFVVTQNKIIFSQNEILCISDCIYLHIYLQLLTYVLTCITYMLTFVPVFTVCASTFANIYAEQI